MHHAASTRTHRLLLVAAGLAAYANSMDGVFVFDDYHAIVENPRVLAAWPPGAVLGGTCRPIVELTLALNHALGGESTTGYHALNVAIHLLAGLALFGVVYRTLRSSGLAERYGSAAANLALAAAGLWTVHPLQTQSVTYIIQRCESLMGLCFLVALYAVIRGAAADRPQGWYTAAVLSSAAGMGCKEVMISAPLIILLYDRTFLSGSLAEALRRRGVWHALLWLTALIIPLLYRFNLHGQVVRSAGFDLAELDWSQYGLVQLCVLLHYLQLSFWPARLCLDYGWPPFLSLQRMVLSAAVLCALLQLTVWASARRHPGGFVGAWFFLILAPTSSLMPIRDVVMEHRMYLPLAAVIVTVVIGGHALCCRPPGCRVPAWVRPTIGAAALAAGIMLAARTAARNQDYSSRVAMWGDVVRQCPGNARGHNNLAQALQAAGRPADALVYYRRALRLNPAYPMAYNSYGTALYETGDAAQALACFQTAVRLQPDYAKAHSNFGNVLLEAGFTESAARHFQKALDLEPGSAEFHNNMGVALSTLGRVRESAECYLTALDLNPHYGDAFNNLGNALLRLGDLEQARLVLLQAVTAHPRLPGAHHNLGILLAQRQDYPAARKHFERALALCPDDQNTHYHLAQILEQQGDLEAAIAHYQRAIQIAPEHHPAKRNLELALQRQRSSPRQPTEY